MSDDHATLLKRTGVAWDPSFKWNPKTQAADEQPPPLPSFTPVT
ncbi:MAG: hypothetical protein ACPIOQ_66370 [Promethearchaeia archaeon]